MRLLHTLTYDVKVFVNNVPLYAILSHTWGDEEVTFQDITVAYKRSSLKGWSKVANACCRAAADGWEYIWIDTCCIDKTNTTELGEAINSMFRWYKDAQICYAYLADVPPRYFVLSSECRVETPLVPWRWYFRSSRWFTRGWTLQELLAPGFLLFLDQQWGNIGAREEWADEIYRATGIGVKHLLDFHQCCIAIKLSWAANRHTTREEDRAYSLLGLLGINMPLIYGEGKRAFIRLQYELISRYNDDTIFAWGDIPSESSVGLSPAFKLILVLTTSGSGRWGTLFMGIYSSTNPGILATSLEDFENSGDITTWVFDRQRPGFSMTNAGLRINAELFEWHKGLSDTESLYVIHLNCSLAWPHSRGTRSPVVIFLTGIDEPLFTIRPPTFLRKAGDVLRDWRQISSSNWRSLGRHDIFITENEGVSEEISGSVIDITFKPPHYESILLGVCRTHDHESWAETLDFGHTDPRSLYNSYKSGLARPKVKKFQLSRNEVLTTVIYVANQGDWKIFLAMLKWKTWFLSYGIWELELSTRNFIPTCLDSLRDRPWPTSARISKDGVVRISATPMPVKGSHSDRAVQIKVTYEMPEPAEHPTAPAFPCR
jgi:Heterokaryon incompatibility protein (HET)